MHQSVMKWVESVAKRIGSLEGLRVLEVGSYDVNGSVRPLFAGAREYIGIDSRPGPGVDRVVTARDLVENLDLEDIDLASNFDIVISTETLEHDPRFWDSLFAMGTVLKSGGHLIITARGNGFPRHDYPGDYWRFTLESVPLLFNLADCAVIEAINDTDRRMPGIFGWGKKR